MRKTLFTIALMAMMLFSTSALNKHRAGLEIGETAPELILSQADNDIKLSQLRGDYVLLTFWSSADAASRIECNRYSAWINANASEKLRHLSVNFDEHPELMAEIVKRDNLDENAQFNVSGQQAAKIINDYGLSRGFGSVLIGPDGRVLRFDPEKSELSSLI